MAPRRSTRLHPQLHASEEATGTARRRNPRLRPPIQASEEVTRRRSSPQLRPQICAGEEGAGVTRRILRRRRGTSPSEPASLPDDDDMLREILIRLPPQPSSLPRASAVCRRWRGLVADAKFNRQFYAHHRKPPLLGFFHLTHQGTVLTSVLDPPDRIPPQRFDLGCIRLLDCRHGLVLTQCTNLNEVLVCDIITRVQRRVAVPLEFRYAIIKGAVFCADVSADHVHGSCHSSPFKVVLLSIHRFDRRFLVCVYSSETGLWGDVISAEEKWQSITSKPMVLVGNCIYWFSIIEGIHEFDLDENRLAVIAMPPVADNIVHYQNWQIIEAGDGVLGFAILSYPHFQLWQRNVNTHGVATWVLWRTFEMHSNPEFPSQIEEEVPRLLGYDEDTDVILIHARGAAYRVQFKLMQWRKLYETRYVIHYLPFRSFYTVGKAVKGWLLYFSPSLSRCITVVDSVYLLSEEKNSSCHSLA